MKTRSSEVELLYNGKAVTTALRRFVTGVTYSDPASGESDTLSIELGDPEALWINAWTPAKGDRLSATLRVHDWLKEGDERALECGKFVLDEYSAAGWPQTATLDAVSAPADDAFGATERSKTWERITLQKIAGDIAARAGLTLAYDAVDIAIGSIEQKEQTDSAFLQELTESYGLCLKVYAEKLVIFDRTRYKAKEAVATIRAEDIAGGYEYRTGLAGSYTGGQISYTDPKTEKDILVKLGEGRRLLMMTEKAESKADAERKLRAAIEKANHDATTLTLSTMGNPSIVASQTVNVVGLGRISGKYYADRVTHTKDSGGYLTAYEFVQVSTGGAVAVEDAVNRLVSVGVINTPDYWIAHHGDIRYLDDLLLNLSVAVRENKHGAGIRTAQEALAVLVDYGVINTADYWQKNISNLAYLDALLIQSANALGGKKL